MRPFLVQSGLRGLLGPCGGCPGGLFWPVSQAALEAHFRAPKGSENAQKRLKTAQNRASEAFQVPSGDPEIRTRSIFTEWKIYVSLHLAAILEEKSAWDTVKYRVSAFAETRKPRILCIKMNFFQRVYRPNEGKNWIFMKKQLLSFEKRVFEESKLEFWAP